MQPEEWIHSHKWTTIAQQGRCLTQRVLELDLRLGIVLPASDAASSLGKHLLTLRHGWPGGVSPWREISVVDLGSLDATVEIARAQDARLLNGSGRIIPGEAPPEGLALVRAIEQLGCDIVVVIPAGLRRVDWNLVSGLALGLIDHPEAAMAIGFEPDPSPLSRFSIRPLMAALQESMAFLVDPSCPLVAVRSSKVRAIPIACTLGYEPALLVDIHHQYGLEGIVQVPVGQLFWSGGERRHMEAAAFRATLALLESAKRCNLVGKLEQFGHVFTTIKQRVGDSLELKSSLQIFDWASAQK